MKKYKIKKTSYAGENLYRGYYLALGCLYFPFTDYSFYKSKIENLIKERQWKDLSKRINGYEKQR